MSKCESCGQDTATRTAVIGDRYYKSVCLPCLGRREDGLSSNAAGNERRRQYEDYAQDTIQPYDAAGKPNPEFYRLYPKSAPKVFTKAEIEQVKRKL